MNQQAIIDLWVIDAKLGDEKAFECLFKHFHQGLLRYAYKIQADRQMAQEAAQNSWLKIAKNISRLNDHRAFKSWLFKTVHWQMLDLLRKQKVEPSCMELDDVAELTMADTKLPREESDITYRDLHFHISQLADIDKQAIHLFYLEEFTLQEIHIVLNVPIGTIKSRLNRARNLLKDKLMAADKPN